MEHLGSQLEILELYILHVLPRNNEWQYAREFVAMSQFLDEERREDLLQTLEVLEEQKHHDQILEANTGNKREEELEHIKDDARVGNNGTRQSRQALSRQSEGEKDYGIDELAPKASRMNDIAPEGKETETKKVPPVKSARFLSRSEKSRAPGKRHSQGASNRSIAFLGALQRLASNVTTTALRSPAGLLRTVLFVVALTLAMSRRDIRELLRRVGASGWERMKRTAGMGVKVSYI